MGIIRLLFAFSVSIFSLLHFSFAGQEAGQNPLDSGWNIKWNSTWETRKEKNIKKFKEAAVSNAQVFQNAFLKDHNRADFYSKAELEGMYDDLPILPLRSSQKDIDTLEKEFTKLSEKTTHYISSESLRDTNERDQIFCRTIVLAILLSHKQVGQIFLDDDQLHAIMEYHSWLTRMTDKIYNKLDHVVWLIPVIGFLEYQYDYSYSTILLSSVGMFFAPKIFLLTGYILAGSIAPKLVQWGLIRSRTGYDSQEALKLYLEMVQQRMQQLQIHNQNLACSDYLSARLQKAHEILFQKK